MVAEWTKELSKFLKRNGRVLICFPEDSALGRDIGEAVIRAGGRPFYWGSDHRWRSLLHLAFTERHKTIVAPPQLLLGLSKLSKQLGTPLFVHHSVLTEPCPDWMREAIAVNLDCSIWFLPREESGEEPHTNLLELKHDLLRWSSIIDCRIVKGSYGLEMQLVSIPGKKLPKFPSLAKLDNQVYAPDRHIPFYLAYDPDKLKNH